MANTKCKIKTAAEASGMTVDLFILNMQLLGFLDMTKKYTGDDYILKENCKFAKFSNSDVSTGVKNDDESI